MGFFFAFLTALAFAASNIFIKKGMKYSDNDNGVPMTVLLNVLFIGIAWGIYRIFAESITFNYQGILYFVLAGLFTTFIGRFVLFKSYRKIGPSSGTAIKNSAPVFTVIFALLFLNETITLFPFIGMIFVFCGLAIQGMVLIKTGSDTQNIQRVGYLLALAAAFSFGVGQGVRKLGIEYIADPFFGAFISAVVALVMMLLLECRKNPIQSAKKFIKWNGYYFIAGICTSVAVLSFFIAMMFIQVSYVAVIAALEPIITIILSKVFLKQEEQISRSTVLAAFIVFIGVIFLVVFA